MVTLAWDDALRARTLRDIVSGTTLVGVSYCLLTTSVMGVVPLATLPPAPAVTNSIATIFLGCGLVAVLCAITPSPGTQFKRRLWPGNPSVAAIARTTTNPP